MTLYLTSCQIERKRQDLAMKHDFEPRKAFNLIDVDCRGSLDADALSQFLNKNYCTCSKQDAEDIIKEYDSDLNKKLSYEEFCQLVLPSASAGLR